jgi:hypothetical protein
MKPRCEMGFKSTYLNLELKLTKMSVPVLFRLPCSLTALHGQPDAAFFFYAFFSIADSHNKKTVFRIQIASV